MNYEQALERLRASTELLRLAELAEIFDRSKSAIRGWGRAYGFPAHVKFADGVRSATRYWRPDHVAAWIEERQRIEAEGIDIDRVCEIVGVHPDTWLSWVAAGSAPKWIWTAIGSGAHLWRETEVRSWLDDRTGGFQLPREYRASRESSKARTSRGRRPNKLNVSSVITFAALTLGLFIDALS